MDVLRINDYRYLYITLKYVTKRMLIDGHESGSNVHSSRRLNQSDEESTKEYHLMKFIGYVPGKIILSIKIRHNFTRIGFKKCGICGSENRENR